MNIYYKIWVDCIIRLRTRETNKKDWKVKGMVAMTFAMTFNFVLLMVLFQKEVLGFYFYEINFPFLSGFANYILTMIVLYILPCYLINYILIFRKCRYVELQKKYKYHEGKLFLKYFLISIFLPIILLWIGVFLSK